MKKTEFVQILARATTYLRTRARMQAFACVAVALVAVLTVTSLAHLEGKSDLSDPKEPHRLSYRASMVRPPLEPHHYPVLPPVEPHIPSR